MKANQTERGKPNPAVKQKQRVSSTKHVIPNISVQRLILLYYKFIGFL